MKSGQPACTNVAGTAPPGRFQHRRIVRGCGPERAVAAERAIGHEHVQVGMPVDQRAEALQAHDRPGVGVALAEGGAQVCQ